MFAMGIFDQAMMVLSLVFGVLIGLTVLAHTLLMRHTKDKPEVRDKAKAVATDLAAKGTVAVLAKIFKR